MKQNAVHNCAVTVVLFITLIANICSKIKKFSLCSSGEIVLNLFLNFEQKWASCSYKIVLIKKCTPNPVTVLFNQYQLVLVTELPCRVIPFVMIKGSED